MDVIVSTGYKARMIENYLHMRYGGAGIKFSAEKSSLGTGGAIKRAGKMIDDESFLVLNGDVITDIDLQALMKRPDSIAAVRLRTKYGILETHEDRVLGFLEKRDASDMWINAGIYHLRREALRDLPVRGDIERTMFPDYAKRGMLGTVKFKNERWYSIDSFKDMEECSLEIEAMMR